MRSRWEEADEPGKSDKRRVLGGTKVGSSAWGLAWVDTIMELPTGEEEEAIKANAERLIKIAEERVAEP